MDEDAGPEAGVPVEQGGKWIVGVALAGGWWKICSCSITRIYTKKHNVPGGNVNVGNGVPRVEPSGAWNQCGKWREPQRRGAEAGEIVPEVGDRRSVNASFPAKTRLGRRKWLISRIWRG